MNIFLYKNLTCIWENKCDISEKYAKKRLTNKLCMEITKKFEIVIDVFIINIIVFATS